MKKKTCFEISLLSPNEKEDYAREVSNVMNIDYEEAFDIVNFFTYTSLDLLDRTNSFNIEAIKVLTSYISINRDKFKVLGIVPSIFNSEMFILSYMLNDQVHHIPFFTNRENDRYDPNSMFQWFIVNDVKLKWINYDKFMSIIDTPDNTCYSRVEHIADYFDYPIRFKKLLKYFGVGGIEIPQDSDQVHQNTITTMIDESISRFSSAEWLENVQKSVIILAGVGGIGSYVGYLLGRLKPKSLFIYDDDKVDIVNLSGQLYSSDDIGTFKVDALARAISKYSYNNNVFAIHEKFTKDTPASDIMICGFDSMYARAQFFSSWWKQVNSKENDEDKKHCLFIDGRLSAEEFQVFCIRGDDAYNVRRYVKEFLFPDSEAEETPCSFKQTSHIANMIASIMVNLFTNFAANEACEGMRDLPFKVTYAADSLTLNVEN